MRWKLLHTELPTSPHFRWYNADHLLRRGTKESECQCLLDASDVCWSRAPLPLTSFEWVQSCQCKDKKRFQSANEQKAPKDQHKRWSFQIVLKAPTLENQYRPRTQPWRGQSRSCTAFNRFLKAQMPNVPRTYLKCQCSMLPSFHSEGKGKMQSSQEGNSTNILEKHQSVVHQIASPLHFLSQNVDLPSKIRSSVKSHICWSIRWKILNKLTISMPKKPWAIGPCCSTNGCSRQNIYGRTEPKRKTTEMCFQVWSLLLLMDQRSDSTSRYWPSNYLKGFKNIPGGCLGFLNLSTVSFIYIFLFRLLCSHNEVDILLEFNMVKFFLKIWCTLWFRILVPSTKLAS